MKAEKNMAVAQTSAQREQMKIVIVGHVDHGKSTLVGRIFHDTDSLPDGKFEQIQATCKKRGMPFEWAFLMDALQSERDQGITIDTTQIWFKTKARDYVIIDAPGHKEFLKNMVSGAASSEAALLIIDANEGVKEQSKRHGYLLHLLGVDQIAVAVNKMDLVDYSEEKFKAIEAEYREYLKGIGVEPTYIIPVSAREGDHIVGESSNMSWYKGPSIVEALDHFQKKPENTELPLRLPLQDVYKFDERRIYSGRIESGSLKLGDTLLFSPSNKVTKIKTIECWNAKEPLKEASAGMSIGLTLEDQLFVERGETASHVEHAPLLSNLFRARLFWLGDNPLEIGKQYKIKINTSEYRAEIQAIEQVVDTDTLSHNEATEVPKNAVAEVVFRVRGLATIDEHIDNPKTGRFVVMENYHVVGGGILDMQGFKDQRVAPKLSGVKSTNVFPVSHKITEEQRAVANGHLGGILWFSGLSGSGKTTLAQELEKRLFAKGYQVYILDGDTVRTGLNADLGFAPEDRSENLRRVGEVATLFAKAGVIVITAFISPYAEDRRRARSAACDAFHSIYIKAPIEVCESRDPKGLYKKARSGEITNFTGVSDRFDEPDNADLIVENGTQTIEESAEQLEAYIEHNLVAPVKRLIEGGEGI